MKLNCVLKAPNYSTLINIITKGGDGHNFNDLTKQNHDLARSSLSLAHDLGSNTDSTSLGFGSDDPFEVEMKIKNNSIGILYWHPVTIELAHNADQASDYVAMDMPDGFIGNTPYNKTPQHGVKIWTENEYTDDAEGAAIYNDGLEVGGGSPKLEINLPKFIKGELEGAAPSGYYQLTLKFRIANAPEAGGADPEFIPSEDEYNDLTYIIEFQAGEAIYIPPECKLTDWHKPDCIPWILQQLFG